MDPTLRAMHARIAAYSKWATTDPVEGTAAARAASMGRFERQVDPDGVLTPSERARRAEAAKKAFYTRMAYLSAKARSKGGVA